MATSNRRTGKAGVGKTGSESSAEAAGSNLRDELQPMSAAMGVQMADVVMAGSLKVMMETLATGNYGPITTQLLTSLKGGMASPFEEWRTELATWDQPMLMPSSESTGSSSSSC